jgi:hypothetical protein
MELEIAIGRALDCLADLSLSIRPEELRWRENLMMRAVAELPVTFRRPGGPSA